MILNADGDWGGGGFSTKKLLRRCKVQRYLALRGGGWGYNFQEESVT